MTDIEIASKVEMKHINFIAEKAGINIEDLEHYGKYKAKIPLSYINEEKVKNNKLVLVTAISPTPAGEGKTTVTIGLTEGMNKIGKKTIAALREPSLGPVFGVKGGATGGGYSQVLPMDDINLHFTGDFNAVEKANNLLAALIDNNIQAKKTNLNIDSRTVTWKRVMDMNDRALRDIIAALGGKQGGFPRQTGFNITAASEIMAVLCLSNNFEHLKEKIDSIFIGETLDQKAVTAKDLQATGAMALLLKDAIKPNLVQTIEGNPAIIHAGPFANIAQGTNSIIATKTAMSLSDYTITEAGFGADLGAEKFLDIKCRYAGIQPSAVVIVATIRALKYHGGKALANLNQEDLAALEKGFVNLQKHIENIRLFGFNPVIAINKFTFDSQAELDLLVSLCNKEGVEAAISNGWAFGGDGCTDLAKLVVEACEKTTNFDFLYNLDDKVENKIETIAKKVYGAANVEYAAKAKTDLEKIYKHGFDKLPICIAKTPNSLSDDPKNLGRPRDFTFNIREIEFATGAGFIVPISGTLLRMPGLPEYPAAINMNIDANGTISGLF